MESREEKVEITYGEREDICRSRFYELGDCWHLFSNGQETNDFFVNDLDFVFGMNLFGIYADKFKDSVKIYTFELMNNHIHIIMGGSLEDCTRFFAEIKKKIIRFVHVNKRDVDPKKIVETIVYIKDLNHLRNEIAYVNRNGYVENKACTPFTYPWGANMYYFNPQLKNIKTSTVNSLSFEKRRKLISSKKVDVSEKLRYMDVHFIDGICLEFTSKDIQKIREDAVEENDDSIGRMIVPSSYCYIKEIEDIFFNAHNYWICATKDHEKRSKIAEAIGEKRYMTDGEIYREALKRSNKLFDTFKISSLSLEQRQSIANYLHFDLRCTNSQIKRVLAIDEKVLGIWYPIAK